jgi:hypothetical protein
VYGQLTVLTSLPRDKHGHSKYECRCSCGKIVNRIISSIIRGHNSNCGCVGNKKGVDSPHWKGCGEISATWFKQAVENSANGSKRKNGKGKEIDIDIKYVWELFLQQNRKCALTGINLEFAKTTTTKMNTTASLDRIDSSIGYLRGNVQWVHKHINMMKQSYDQDYFIKMCKFVADQAAK